MKRVLIVDDSKFARIILRKMLEESGFEIVAEAETDVEAVEKYKQFRPDLVTMDIILPIENGLKAVKEIMAFDSQAKIIMVSAMGQEKIVEEALQLGAKGFVVKPISKEKLINEVNKVINS
jgi:two-component system chemotaxis response regulator CheY